MPRARKPVWDGTGPAPEVMSVAEASLYTGIGEDVIRRACDRGALKHSHKGPNLKGGYVLRKANVDAWLDSHEHPKSDTLPLAVGMKNPFTMPGLMRSYMRLPSRR